MTWKRLLVVVTGALLLGACSEQTSPEGDGLPPTATGNVSVQDNQFVASNVRVLAGGTVTWTWRGSNQHNVTFTGGPASTTQTDGTFQRSFPIAGSFSYTCTVHGQSMSGRVTVIAPEQSAE